MVSAGSIEEIGAPTSLSPSGIGAVSSVPIEPMEISIEEGSAGGTPTVLIEAIEVPIELGSVFWAQTPLD